ncbi:MAG: hypothetical protein ACE14V_10355 [bacterium]
MGRDNRNEMRKQHQKKSRSLQAKLKLIREKLGITIYPNQWEKISLPAREQMLKAIFPERYARPQPQQHPQSQSAPTSAPAANPEQKSG